MTEIYMPVVVCDKCAPGELPAIDRGTHMFDMKPTSYCVGFGVVQALEGLGWEECEYGHLCPDCAKTEKEVAEQDEATGVEHGAVGDLPPFISPKEYDKLVQEQEVYLNEEEGIN